MEDHVQSFLASYKTTLDQSIVLPANVAERYDLCDCLRATSVKSTFLLQNKADGALAVLKVAAKSAPCDLESEYLVLQALHSPAFPQAISFCTDGKVNYLIRSYIAGLPVSDYVEKYGAFREPETIRLGIGLCRSLNLLHIQRPPVIHRDIKPQNVIYTADHTLALIDFDTVRHYQSEQRKDTTFLGTEATAAPEQYGYKQTDQRSDIYSTGVLLLYLCTGSYDLDFCANIRNRNLARIIRTCTQFDPDRRFSSMHQLQARLERAERAASHSASSFLRGSALGLFAGFGLAFSLSKLGVLPAGLKSAPAVAADALPAATATVKVPVAITFDSPQIEQAVRNQLGYDADTPLYQDDLNRISKLLIFGTDELSTWYDVNSCVMGYSNKTRGSIDTLSDIPKLKNLTELAICNQNITDLSPLSGMQFIRLALSGNQISDISALSDLPYVTELYLGSNPVVNIDALTNYTFLRILDLSRTNVLDISPLAGQEINELYLNEAPVDAFAPLSSISSLERLSVSDMNQSELALISQLTTLTYFEYRGKLTTISPVFQLTNLTGLMVFDTALTSVEGIEALKDLNYFCLGGSPNMDLSMLTQLSKLTALDIALQKLSDYSIVFKFKNLQILYCNAEQKAALEATGKAIQFEMQVV